MSIANETFYKFVSGFLGIIIVGVLVVAAAKFVSRDQAPTQTAGTVTTSSPTQPSR